MNWLQAAGMWMIGMGKPEICRTGRAWQSIFSRILQRTQARQGVVAASRTTASDGFAGQVLPWRERPVRERAADRLKKIVFRNGNRTYGGLPGIQIAALSHCLKSRKMNRLSPAVQGDCNKWEGCGSAECRPDVRDLLLMKSTGAACRLK